MYVRVLVLYKDGVDISNQRCLPPVLRKKTARSSPTPNLPETPQYCQLLRFTFLV